MSLMHPGEAHAGAGRDHSAAAFDWLTSWSWDPLVSASLAISAGLYGRGLMRLWRTPAGRRTVRPWQAAAFAAGWLSLVIALISPLDVLSDILFSAHMTQHELLMVIAAPLMVLGRPLIVMLWAFGAGHRQRLTVWTRTPLVARTWQGVTGPLTVWVLHGLALWIWHLPVLYQAALESDAVHVVQHLSFFITAALFWWALVHGRYGRIGYGMAVLFVFTTALHSGALGALFTFGSEVMYPLYAERSAAFGVSALEDQQLAGLIMWIPFSLTFLVVGLALFAAWLGESDRRLGFARGPFSTEPETPHG
jgi:putative membrane protein